MNFPKEISTIFKLMNDEIRYYLHWLPRIQMHSNCPLPEQLRCSKARLNWPVRLESQMTRIYSDYLYLLVLAELGRLNSLKKAEFNYVRNVSKYYN